MAKISKANGLRKDFILEKAGKLFWEKGYEGTSLQDIANACGCKQANLYNYFRSKEQMLFEVLLAELEQSVSVVQYLEDEKHLDPVERLRLLIETSVKINLIYRPTSSMLFDAGLKSLSRTHKENIIEKRNMYDMIVRKIINDGITSGVFNDFNDKVLCYAIDSMILRNRIWFSPKGELAAEEVAKILSEFILKGMIARNST